MTGRNAMPNTTQVSLKTVDAGPEASQSIAEKLGDIKTEFEGDLISANVYPISSGGTVTGWAIVKIYSHTTESAPAPEE
jgi:hypothetical protein